MSLTSSKGRKATGPASTTQGDGEAARATSPEHVARAAGAAARQ